MNNVPTLPMQNEVAPRYWDRVVPEGAAPVALPEEATIKTFAAPHAIGFKDGIQGRPGQETSGGESLMGLRPLTFHPRPLGSV